MNITTTKQVAKEVTTGYKCDVCGHVNDGERYPNDWLLMSHQHHGWGNDSIESYKQFDLCSINCFKERLKQSLYEMRNDKNTADIFGMSYEFAQSLYDRL